MALVVLATFCRIATAAAEPDCAGRYEAARQMVDAAIRKYGTLYSGGFHWHYLDDVGATVDLYRLWRGLPDLRLRDNEVEVSWNDVPELDAANGRDEVDRALHIMEAAHPALDREGLRLAAVSLDLATTAGHDEVGWWRDPARFPALTPVREAVAQLAPDRPALDWLQAVVTGSDSSWSYLWHLEQKADGPPHETLARYALAKFHAGAGIEWAVAALVLVPRGTTIEADLKALQDQWQAGVRDCRASPQEYAAWAASVAATSRLFGAPQGMEFLPDSVQTMIRRNRAMLAAFEKKDVSEIRMDKGAENWSVHFYPEQIHAAGTVTQLEAFNPLPYRAINLLPAAAIAQLARNSKADGAAGLVKVAFARLVALGRWDQAAALLAGVKAVLTPDEVMAVDAIWGSRMPDEAKLSLIALRTDASTWVTGGAGDAGLELFDQQQTRYSGHFIRDLPPEFKEGAAVQGDFETWLMLPQKWYRYRTMRGYMVDALGRDTHRVSVGRERPDVTAPQLFAADSPFGIRRLAALDEVEALTGSQRFSRSVSQVLLRWASQASDSWWKRLIGDREMVPEALYRVLVMSRYEDAGEIDGVPVGKRAFQMLHKRFPRSEWTRKARHWHAWPGG